MKTPGDETPELKFLYRCVAAAAALLCLQPSLARAAPSMAQTPAAAVLSAARRAVSSALGAHGKSAQLEFAALDPHLRLPACAQQLTVQFDAAALREHQRLSVSCSAPAAWTVHLRATLSVSAEVLVARHALPRSASLQATDFELRTLRVAGSPDAYLGAHSVLEGRSLTRALAMGEALAVTAVRTDPIVRRGQRVTLSAHTGGIEVRIGAVALADAAYAERVRVRSGSSGTLLDAIVRGPGQVELPL